MFYGKASSGVSWGQICEPPGSSGPRSTTCPAGLFVRPQDKDDLRGDSILCSENEGSLTKHTLKNVLYKCQWVFLWVFEGQGQAAVCPPAFSTNQNIFLFFIRLTVGKRREVFSLVLMVPWATPHRRETVGKASDILTPFHHSTYWVDCLHLQHIHFCERKST